MNTNRLTKLIVGAILIAAALVVYQALTTSGTAERGNRPYAGMGDLHRFEAQASIRNSGALESDYVGMGDLRRFEYLQESNSPSP